MRTSQLHTIAEALAQQQRNPLEKGASRMSHQAKMDTASLRTWRRDGLHRVIQMGIYLRLLIAASTTANILVRASFYCKKRQIVFFELRFRGLSFKGL